MTTAQLMVIGGAVLMLYVLWTVKCFLSIREDYRRAQEWGRIKDRMDAACDAIASGNEEQMEAAVAEVDRIEAECSKLEKQ